MRPDSPEGVAVTPALPDIPFRITIPADAGAAEYQLINVEIWRRLQKCQSLWGLDFAPSLPPPQGTGSSSAMLLGAAFVGVFFMACAFSSRN
jgi:hypothetical protein